ncbi:MAG: hypothetical protein HOQ24_09600, partial [Mycobacteriaceae bacterium]|nr:hypothetical protein [Mycobacteriaceae bacterium]
MTLDEVADELYGLEPTRFVEVRKQRSGQARAAGDRALATAIDRLRKPTVVGWAVNVLAREAAAELETLLELGVRLRGAQHSPTPKALRELTKLRLAAVHRLTERARALTAEHGHRLSTAAEREVVQTLHAALAEPDIADLVQAGRLIAAVDYSGFGPPGLSAVPDAGLSADPDLPDATGSDAPGSDAAGSDATGS